MLRTCCLFPTLLLCVSCAKDPADAIETYADEVCECENSDCVEQVRSSWENENVERLEATNLTGDQTSRIETAVAKALDCQAQLQ
jgi:hypothetical protein